MGVFVMDATSCGWSQHLLFLVLKWEMHVHLRGTWCDWGKGDVFVFLTNHLPCHPFFSSFTHSLLNLCPVDFGQGHCQVGSLAGAAHLLKGNAGVQRRAQQGRKPCQEQKGKSSFDFVTFSANTNRESVAYRSFNRFLLGILKLEVSEKLPQG